MFKLIMDILCILVLIFAVITVLYYFFPVAQINGNSMKPTFRDKQIILVRRLIGKFHVKEGEIYLVQSPTGRIAIKRLAHKNDKEDFQTNLTHIYYWLQIGRAEREGETLQNIWRC